MKEKDDYAKSRDQVRIPRLNIMSLPYPGYNESYSSWDFKCRQYENRQAEWRREQHYRSLNWGGNNKYAILRDTAYHAPDGRVLQCARVGKGNGNAKRVRRFAINNRLIFECFKIRGGATNGFTDRRDGVAYPASVLTESDTSPYNQDI